MTVVLESDVPSEAPAAVPTPAPRARQDIVDVSEGNLITAAMIGFPVFLMLALCIVVGYKYSVRRLRRSKRRHSHCQLRDAVSTHFAYTQPRPSGDDFVTIYKRSNEPAGVLWEDHTVVSGVLPNSAAHRCEVDAYLHRRVHSVNNVPVLKLDEIRELCEGRTMVTLGFEPRFSRIVVQLDQCVQSFNETAFLAELAKRVSCAFEMKFGVPNVVAEKVQQNGFECQVLLHLRGLTSGQIAALVAMCRTPGDGVRSKTNIINARIADDLDDAATTPPTTHLWLCAQWLQEAAGCSGLYIEMPYYVNDMPCFQHAPADHWIYSTPSGEWVVTADRDVVGQEAPIFVLRSAAPHYGSLPQDVAAWCSPLRDVEVVVSDREPVAHEFVIGQKVALMEDVILEDASSLTRGAQGLIMGAHRDLVCVCLLNCNSDVVTLPPALLESPDGPRVHALREGAWLAASIVKQTRSGDVLVRYDCAMCPPEWVSSTDARHVLRSLAVLSFEVGDAVALSDIDFDPAGPLSPEDVGKVVAVGDEGQVKTYLVRGGYEEWWYSARQLVPYQMGCGL